MALIQSGDHRALGEFYDATVGRVYARALRITGNAADADEVTGDVYYQLWRKANCFDAGRGNASQWLMAWYAIAPSITADVA